uniref:hypothetical protein n=1 Tax=Pontibacter mangrovi TaxID=2589816 RepID=UPI00112692E5|nr:hypothetical protein [Pontibacter mangrovi]
MNLHVGVGRVEVAGQAQSRAQQLGINYFAVSVIFSVNGMEEMSMKQYMVMVCSLLAVTV